MVGGTFPIARFLEYFNRNQPVFQIRRRPDVIQAAAFVVSLPVRIAVAPPGIGTGAVGVQCAEGVGKAAGEKLRHFRPLLIGEAGVHAVGLGIFTVLGVYTAHGEGYDGIFFLVFLGMMTGIGGGLIRDILADTMPFILYKHIYAMAAFAGALVCVLLIHIHLYLALAAGTAVVIVIRVLATHYCWDLPRPLHEKDAHTKTKNLSENSNADDT